MSDKEINLDNLMTINGEDLTVYGEEMLKYNISVYRKNSEGRLVEVILDDLDKLFGDKKREGYFFFVQKDWPSLIASKIEKSERGDPYPERTRDDKTAYGADYQNRINKYSKMSVEERRKHLEERRKKLKDASKASTFSEEFAHQMLEASIEMNVVVKVTMFETLSSLSSGKISVEEARKITQGITEETAGITKNIVESLTAHSEIRSVLQTYENYKGGNTIAHINRVFIGYTQALIYYNRYISEGGVPKIRLDFKNTYKFFYNKLLNRDDIETLEEAYDGGMIRLSETDILGFSIGALLHDIGKVQDIEYFDSSSARDLMRIKKHVYNGYYLISQTSHYPPAVSLMAALHHEYYGSESGYGLYRDLLASARKNRNISPSFAVSYNPASLDNFSAFSFFPAKLLEVVDVFDSLTDPARKYRSKSFTSSEALSLMRDSFVYEHRKLDPILFDLYIDFLGEETGENYSSYKVKAGGV